MKKADWDSQSGLLTSSNVLELPGFLGLPFRHARRVELGDLPTDVVGGFLEVRSEHLASPVGLWQVFPCVLGSGGFEKIGDGKVEVFVHLAKNEMGVVGIRPSKHLLKLSVDNPNLGVPQIVQDAWC